MNGADKFETTTYPSSRLLTQDFCHIGARKHYVQALIELDITRARQKLREAKKRTGNISFTSWLLKCIAQACSEHREIHAMLRGKNKLVLFDDVDISIVVEREVEGKRVPLPYVVRKANEKSISDICTEIENAKSSAIADEGDYVLGGGRSAWQMRLFCSLPAFLRRFFINRILRNPLAAKKMMGTVVVTSLGMVGRFNGWFVPLGVHPLIIATGSIRKKPGVAGDKIEIREYLSVTILVDHDAVDGAPAARALTRLTELVEGGYGL